MCLITDLTERQDLPSTGTTEDLSETRMESHFGQ